MAYINDRTSGFLGWMAARAIAGQRMAAKTKEYLYFSFDQTALELNFMDDSAASENGYYSYVQASVALSGDTLIVNE